MKNFKISLKKFLILVTNKLITLVFFFSARTFVLRLTGAKVGKLVAVHSNVRFYSLGNLQIGNNSTINRFVFIDNRGNVRVGNNVNISHSCQIYTQSHDLESDGALLTTKNVVIEDNAWLYPNVKIMPGVTIGKGAVIYPSSVVTKNVEDFSITGGNPAVHIRYRNKEASWKLNNRIHFSL